jgi:cytochrome P450
VKSEAAFAQAVPGPQGRGIRHFLERTRNYAGLLTRLHREYGPIAAFQVLQKRSCALYEPELVHEVLVTKRDLFTKGAVVTENRVLRGKTLFSSDGGEDHLRRRKLAQPSFHRKAINGYARVMLEEAEKLGGRWSDGAVVDVSADMHALTLHIVARTFFGDEISVAPATVAAVLEGMIHWGILGMLPCGKLLHSLPTPINRRTRRALAELDAAIYGIIRLAHENPERPELIALLANARDEDGIYQAYQDWEVRDEALTILMAGHETTANAMAWTFHHLARNPEARARVQEELAAVLQGRPPAVEDYGRLEYLRAVCDETLRLSPPVYFLGRRAREDCALGGYFIPKGTVVQPATFVLHRNPEYFPEPEAFRPERWLEERIKHIPKFAYIPFGGGSRVCIGEGFAKMELVLVLATLLRHWSLESVSDREPKVDMKMVYQPKNGLPMRLRRR